MNSDSGWYYLSASNLEELEKLFYDYTIAISSSKSVIHIVQNHSIACAIKSALVAEYKSCIDVILALAVEQEIRNRRDAKDQILNDDMPDTRDSDINLVSINNYTKHLAYLNKRLSDYEEICFREFIPSFTTEVSKEELMGLINSMLTDNTSLMDTDDSIEMVERQTEELLDMLRDEYIQEKGEDAFEAFSNSMRQKALEYHSQYLTPSNFTIKHPDDIIAYDDFYAYVKHHSRNAELLSLTRKNLIAYTTKDDFDPLELEERREEISKCYDDSNAVWNSIVDLHIIESVQGNVSDWE